uniref:melanoma-associated antigen B10-like n=1 Tax=Jaculus jaculus TaxID=51337 RepID=UPI00033341C8|nr:melanoma-associated antigen B10-like [Jaculus jaculus]
MPRGHKSKLRAREKRRQAQKELKDSCGTEATVVEEEEPSSSTPEIKAVSQESSAAGAIYTQEELEETPSILAASIPITSPKSNEGAKNQVEEKPDDLEVSVKKLQTHPIHAKVAVLVNYLLYKYQVKEPITKAEMLKNVMKTCKNHFPIILRKACDHVELLFGLDMKEVDPKKNTYVLINKLDLDDDTTVSDYRGIPMTGLLMTVLGVIFSKGNCATEEQVWVVLNMMGICEGKNHFIFGDAKKFITKDLVEKNYLEYQQVPGSDPPRHQLLWGPRSYAETNKMKVLKFLCKIHECVPSNFEALYEEALKDEEERAKAKAIAKARNTSRASSSCKAMSRFSCSK